MALAPLRAQRGYWGSALSLLVGIVATAVAVALQHLRASQTEILGYNFSTLHALAGPLLAAAAASYMLLDRYLSGRKADKAQRATAQEAAELMERVRSIVVNSRTEANATYYQSVIDFGRNIYGHRQIRLGFYELEQSQVGDSEASLSLRLKAKHAVHHPYTAQMVQHDMIDDTPSINRQFERIYNHIHGQKHLLVTNTRKATANWPGLSRREAQQKPYKCFLSMPVFTYSEKQNLNIFAGYLCIDAPGKKELSAKDIQWGALLSELLQLGLDSGHQIQGTRLPVAPNISKQAISA